MYRLNPGRMLLAGLVLCASATFAGAEPSVAPTVTLSVTLPDGQVKELTTTESGLATVTVGSREYGFRPTMLDDQGTRMTITIFDMGAATESVREIGLVDIKGGGPVVPSKTTPAFKLTARKAAKSPTT
jgi:hypothetical protein